MKKIFFTTLITTFTLGILLSNQLLAGNETTKTLAEKSFSIKPDADLVVNHEQGNVYCKNWDKNEISVTITAYADTKENEQAEKAFSKISYEVKGNTNEVIVQSKLTGKSGAGSTNVWVDIEIYMPKTINLNFSHKFGKAFIENVDGTALISSDYGSINVNNISNSESKIKITYGEGQVNNFLGNSIIVQYSKFDFGITNDVSIKSEYSDIDGGETGNSLIKMEGGNLYLKQVESIKGSSSFSSLNIDYLANSLDIETGYGSLNVDNVSASFTEIKIENNFGSANLRIQSSASYVFDALATFGSIVYPEDKSDITYREKTTQKTILQGKIGDNSNPTSKVNLKSNYGSINIEN